MSTNNSKTRNKRERLVEAAAELFHHQGPLSTSLADVAEKASVPIGNVYYYFKTKEELILAVIEKRREIFNQAFDALNHAVADPRTRLLEMVSYFDSVADDYTRYGCPLGRMAMELDTESLASQKAATAALNDFVEWAAQQFDALGHTIEAKQLATSLLAGVQGAAVMAHAYRQSEIFSSEMIRLTQWLESIPNTRIRIGKGAVH